MPQILEQAKRPIKLESTGDTGGVRTLGPKEVEAALPIYDPDTTLELDGADLVAKDRIVTRRTVRESDTLPHFAFGELKLGKPNESGYATRSFTVDNKRTFGHFLPIKSEDPTKPDLELEVMRGVDGIAAFIETADLSHQDPIEGSPYRVFPRLIKGPIEFLQPIVPGDSPRISLDFSEVKDEKYISAGGTVEVDGVTATKIPGVELVWGGYNGVPSVKSSMTVPRMIEAAAQSVGIAFINRRNVDKSETVAALQEKESNGSLTPSEARELNKLQTQKDRPMGALFMGIRDNMQFFRPVYTGETVEFDTQLLDVEEQVKAEDGTSRIQKVTLGYVLATVGNETVAIIPGIEGAFVPAAAVKRQVDKMVNARRGPKSETVFEEGKN